MRINKIMLLVMLALAFAAFNVAAANQNVTQQNITTNLSIYDVPSIGIVTLDDADGVASGIDPTPATTTTITCQATVTDLDGGGDISGANATFYHTATGHAAADAPLNHYTDAACALNNVLGNTVDVNCTVDIQFYVEHGTWECNMTVIDGYSLTDSAQGTETVNDLLAFAVTNTDLDFGQLAVGENTTTTDYDRTITNNGNVNLSMSLNTWGTVLGDNLAMTCSTGNIPDDEMRYDTGTNTAYGSKTSIVADGATGGAVAAFAVNHATSGVVGTTGDLHFGMGVSGAGSPTGVCSGNLMFTASEV